jgi:hypothetical protein
MVIVWNHAWPSSLRRFSIAGQIWNSMIRTCRTPTSCFCSDLRFHRNRIDGAQRQATVVCPTPRRAQDGAFPPAPAMAIFFQRTCSRDVRRSYNKARLCATRASSTAGSREHPVLRPAHVLQQNLPPRNFPLLQGRHFVVSFKNGAEGEKLYLIVAPATISIVDVITHFLSTQMDPFLFSERAHAHVFHSSLLSLLVLFD